MFRNSADRVVIVTGGTGLIGSWTCRKLLVEGTQKIVVLTRKGSNRTSLPASPALTYLDADITQPRLGLDTRPYESLQRSATRIVHCAADTRFGVPLESIRRVNLDGTKNLIDLALHCSRLERFVHVSTAYVAGRSAGSIPEAPNPHTNGFFNTYQQSKYEAEAAVAAAMGRIPADIVRLTSVIGEAQSGSVSRFNYVHQVLRLLPRNVLPVAPGDPNAPVDLIPTEWATTALAHVVLSTGAVGRVMHLCAGPENSYTVGQILQQTAAEFEKHPVGRTWCPIQLPELIGLPEFEAYVARIRQKDDKLLNSLVTALGYFLPHLSTVQCFERAEAAKALAGCSVRLPHIREYYSKIVAFCLDSGWIGRRKSGTPGVAANAAGDPAVGRAAEQP